MDPTFVDRALVLGDTLVLADWHLGKGAATLELPVGDTSDVLERFESLLEAHAPETAVIAGDLLHSFSTVPLAVRDAVEGIQSIAQEAGVGVVVTPGNHDNRLSAVWDGPAPAEYRVGETVVCHGHEEPDDTAARYVVGHDHPTIEIEGKRRPCYLLAEDAYRGSAVLMVPAFNRLLAGTPVNAMRDGDVMSPLLDDLEDAKPIVWDDAEREALQFPPLGEFRDML